MTNYLFQLFAILQKGQFLYRVVCCAVHLCGDDSPDKVNGVVRDAVHLRAAAQRVRVLNAVAEAMAL